MKNLSRVTRGYKKRSINKGIIFISLLCLSLLTLLMGISIFMVKSPDQKAAHYIPFIVAQEQQTQSYNLIVEALEVSLDNPDTWKLYAYQLVKMNQLDKAIRARNVAISLGAKDFQTTKVANTLMPVRHLALSDSSAFSTIQR